MLANPGKAPEPCFPYLCASHGQQCHAVLFCVRGILLSTNATLMQVLAAMAVASEDIAQQALTPALIKELLAISQRDCPEACCAALKTLSSLAFPPKNKATLLKSPDLIDSVAQMAAAGGGACNQARPALPPLCPRQLSACMACMHGDRPCGKCGGLLSSARLGVCCGCSHAMCVWFGVCRSGLRRCECWRCWARTTQWTGQWGSGRCRAAGCACWRWTVAA